MRVVQNWGPVLEERLIRPKGSARPLCPSEVNLPHIGNDYAEACLVLAGSSKAAAAFRIYCATMSR